MESLSEEACDKIDQIFSKDKIALEVAGTSINEAFEIFYRNNKVTGIDGHHGYQNQADKQPLISSMEDILFKYLIWNQKPPKVRKTGVLPGFLKTQQSRQAGKVLTGVFDKCAHLYAYPNSRHECINCMFHSINTDMIISTISQTEVMVFFRKTDISATVDCIENKVCARIERRLPVDCYTHRMYHKFNPNVYPELSIFESLQLDERFCAVISHTAVNQNYCTTCVKRTSPTKTHELVSERYSVLLSSITENKGYGWHELERTLRECYGGAMTKCAKMQLVSEMICSEHKQYKESLQSGDRLCKDTREKLRMGKDEDLLWPPSNTVAHGNTIFDERAVLMVEFEARRPEMCIRCMVLRTEVFYFSVMSHHHKQFGYLWMTQNHKSILEYCLGELICTDLWHLKKSSNLVIRRSGLRPLCNGDLDLLFL
ncbi:unnamed protein product [Albugo candida]|uniref:Uncharacterized protein n=1 Tax=Albugo candida TaxID=65357 RepID=A0A024FW84_9STRA|nr:unnamed protein product [Albugo candida]|eukprot:CCI11380.1 unnamed protein product [Albugo candida]